MVPQEGLGPKEAQEEVERQFDKELGEDEEKKMIEEIHADTVGVRVSLASSSFFDSGSALIKEEALPALDKIAKVLSRTTKRLIVEGHTDNQAIKSKQFPSNWELSSARASTIVRYLIMLYNIPPSRFIAVGYADQHPLVKNDSPENRSKNRRIDILIVGDEKKVGL